MTRSCSPSSTVHDPYGITENQFYDLTDPVHPTLITEFVPLSQAGRKVKPHEMYLWVGRNEARPPWRHARDSRALLFLSTPDLSIDPTRPNLVVYDISAVPDGAAPTLVAEGTWNDRYPGTDQPNYPFDPASPDGCGPYDCNLFVHSMAVKPDGTRTYLSIEAGHFLVLDTSDLVRDPPAGVLSLSDMLLTDPADRAVWLQNPDDPAAVPFVFPNGCERTVTLPSGVVVAKDCPNGHSAVPVPGRDLVVTTDEVYGTFTLPQFGCRWGWMRLIDISDPAQPSITGELLIDENRLAFCGSPADTAVAEQFRSFSSHNPTVLRHLALVTWHSGGMLAVDITDPRHPRTTAQLRPDPLPVVATEDPGLSQGPATTVEELLNPDVTHPDFRSKVVMWSYPIIKDGLIYVVDVRNGLYVLRYRGEHQGEVRGVEFLEGNSNLGDARQLDRDHAW